MVPSHPDTPKLHLQERDMAILEGFLVSRVMTSAHVAALFFDGRAEAAKKRLQKLKAEGLVAERPRKVSEPAILYLTKTGIEMLGKEGVLVRHPPLSVSTLARRASVSPLTIGHEIAVMEFRVALHAAVSKQSQWQMVEFSTWPKLHEFESETAGGVPITVRPDGFVRIHETETSGIAEHVFFAEIDRSSESLDTLVQKAIGYLNFYRSGAFAVRCGGKRADAVKFPFRVLFVLKTEERRNNFAERLLRSHPPILTMAYLATAADAEADPLGKVWMRPIDYRDAVAGSKFDVVDSPVRFAFQRNSAREALVRGRVPLHKLLG